MSKSQIKRIAQQKELEQQEAQNETEEFEPVKRKGPANRFAFLVEEDDEEESNIKSEEENDEAIPKAVKTNKNKNKKNKNKKNNKKKEKKQETENDSNFVEETEEEMLNRIAEENKNSLEFESLTCATPAVESLMKVDTKLFDPSVELKKVLGKTFKENGGNISNQTNRNSRWKPIGRIVKSKMSWPPVKSIGLTMVHDKDENGIRWFKFVHNSNYEMLERMYWLAEDQMNIGGAQEILETSWYHLNSLLMASNMYQMQEDVTQSGDTIERGIFYCEQMFSSQFQPFSWQHRIDYLEYENRAFYLLLHRHMLNALHKRCFETSLNVAKFIFKLDPQKDPLAITVIIDSLAIKAKKYQWILQFYDSAVKWKNLMLLPNMRYSCALAHFLSAETDEEVEIANNALASAIRAFPSVVTALLDELQIHPDSLVMNHEHFSAFAVDKEPEGLKMLTKIYAKQMAEIWKKAENLSWLETVTRKVAEDKSDQTVEEMKKWKERRQKVFVGTSPNIQRLSALLGLSVSKSLTDPIPPKKGRARYRREDHVERAGRDSFLSGLLHSLHPNFNEQDTLREFTERVNNLFRDELGTLQRHVHDFFSQNSDQNDEIRQENEQLEGSRQDEEGRQEDRQEDP